MTIVIDRTREHPVAAKAGPVSAAAAAREKAKRGVGLYKPRTPIYPKLVHGRWRTIKWIVLVATLAVYYVIPGSAGPGPPARRSRRCWSISPAAVSTSSSSSSGRRRSISSPAFW